MKVSIVRRKWYGGRVISALLSSLLIAALVSPAAADVFTNPASITVNDAVTIGAGNPYPSGIAVSGMTGNITGITVTLTNFNHSFPDDCDILLASPTGANMILLSDAGGSDDIYGATYTFDDAAAASMSDTVRNFSGAYKPTNFVAGDIWPAPAPAPSANTTLASAFGGTDPNGTWNLFVVDDLGVDMGAIGNGWSLNVTTSGSPATVFSNNTPIYGGDGARGRATPYASTITVAGMTGAVSNVKVTLTNVNHLNPDDLDIVLVSPRGKRILLLSDAGGTTDAVSANLTFDDAAAAGVPDAGPLVTATVRPTNFGTGDTLPDLNGLYPNSATAGSATLASVFNGAEPNGAWSLYITDDATASAGTVTGGWSLDITAGGTFGAKRFTSTDFEGDGRSDVSVFRPSDNTWYLRDSRAYNQAYVQFGAAGDQIVPGDYDGDGRTDVAVFRPDNGYWIALNSATSTVSFTQWGLSTDTPVQADYDGDGKVDVGVWRASNGRWYVRESATATFRQINWGINGDIPVMGHFEGTNGADFTVFRPSQNRWYILSNNNSSSRQVNWGTSGDVLTPADYDGDGKTDIAIFRPSEGNWHTINSASGLATILHFGQDGDTPVPGDYDGDSRADVTVWRGGNSGGAWFINNSGTPIGAASLAFNNWGDAGDIPIGSAY